MDSDPLCTGGSAIGITGPSKVKLTSNDAPPVRMLHRSVHRSGSGPYSNNSFVETGLSPKHDWRLRIRPLKVKLTSNDAPV
jgi:hypothetical protein